MKLSTLVARLSGAGLVATAHRTGLPGGRTAEADPDIQTITDDSRSVGGGVLFAAVGRAREFLAQAVAGGAGAVLIEAPRPGQQGSAEVHFARALVDFPGPVIYSAEPERALGFLAAELWGRPTDAIELTGVTGTNGKTSFAWMMHHSLLALGLPSAMIGTLGVLARDAAGVEFAEQTGYTTPRAPELQRILASLRDRGIRRVVLEASSEGLNLGRLWGCRFACAVFTNLTRDHLDHHGTMEHYFESKRLLLEMAARDGGRIIVWGDDPAGQRLAREFPEAELLMEADVEAMPMPARFQRVNAALVRQALTGQGGLHLLRGEVSARVQEELPEILARIAPVPGRFNVIVPADAPERSGIVGVVDYAHTPDAVRNVLSAARDLGADRIVCVLGCGGDRDRGKRGPMGAVAAELADCLIVTDDNPRTEDPAPIRAAILAGARGAIEAERVGRPVMELREIASRRDAIRSAVEWARLLSRDVRSVAVVVAGKGHEEEQIFAHGREPFSDVQELQAAFDLGSSQAR